MELVKRNLKKLLEFNFSVEKVGFHICKYEQGYIVLQFNGKSDLINEWKFQDIDQAVNKFWELIKC